MWLRICSGLGRSRASMPGRGPWPGAGGCWAKLAVAKAMLAMAPLRARVLIVFICGLQLRPSEDFHGGRPPFRRSFFFA